MKRRAGKSIGLKAESKPTSFVGQSLSERSNRLRYIAVTLLILLSLFIIWLLPSPIDPVEFEYSSEECSFSADPLRVNDHLKSGRRLFENEIIGPEAFAVNKNGDIFSGLADGKIIRIDSTLKGYHNVTRTAQMYLEDCESRGVVDEMQCGRPLGMEFHPYNADELFVADSSYGLLKVNVRSGVIDILVKKEATYPAMKFPNDLVILGNGSVFFTDSSTRFSRVDHMMDILEGRANGRLLHYNPISRSVSVVLDGLFFPNGICLSNDQRSLLIAETTRARILQFHMQGEMEGKTVVFSGNLPGLPDNISPSHDRDGYFVGVGATRFSKVLDYFAKYPTWRSVIAKLHLVNLIKVVMPQHGLIFKLDNDGRIVKTLHDVGGTVTSTASHVLDLGDQLIVGSYTAPYIVVLSV